MNEIWKDIKNFEDYQISNLGQIKCKRKLVIDKNGNKRIRKEKIKKCYIDRYGYLCTTLWYNKVNSKHFLVHRLVAKAFIPNPDNLPCINHKDENKLNNCVDNLEWCTIKYNNNYGTRKQKACEKQKEISKKRNYNFEKNPNSKLTNKQRIEIKRKYDLGITKTKLQKEYNVGRSCIDTALKFEGGE